MAKSCPKTKKGKQKKFEKVMKEYSKGKLTHGGSGKAVKRREVAQAIAASESGMKRKKSKKKSKK